MREIIHQPPEALKERTQQFARATYGFVGGLKKDKVNFEIAKKLIRSAGAVGENYIEAYKASSTEDFQERIEICRRESQENYYWLNLLSIEEQNGSEKHQWLIQESDALRQVFSVILGKAS